jgi:hypothetical protein
MLPALRDELAGYRARLRDPEPGALVFGTAIGTMQSTTNVRRRVLARAVQEANAAIVEADGGELAAGEADAAQPASHVRVAAVRGGRDPAVRDGSDGPHDRVADAVHLRARDDRRDGEPERLRALVNGEEWAPVGTKASEAVIEAESA